jgi:hypothetical protein
MVLFAKLMLTDLGWRQECGWGWFGDCQGWVGGVGVGFGMLNALDRLKELGLEEPGRAGATLVMDRLGELDWARLADLMRGLVVEAGCELTGTQVQADASVLFGMIEHPGTERKQRVLVKLAAWNDWGAQAEHVERFAAEVRAAREARGILVAPAGFSPGAREAAGRHRIEMVDGEALQEALGRLPAERRAFLWEVASSGDAWRPGCPMCLGKLSPVQSSAMEAVEAEEERMLFKDTIVAEAVYCRRLRVVRGVEVQFLQGVRAQQMEIEGTVCEGMLHLLPTAVVHGVVAAKGIRVEDGAQLLADVTVLQAALAPVTRASLTWQWRCLSGSAVCAGVALEPHAAKPGE